MTSIVDIFLPKVAASDWETRKGLKEEAEHSKTLDFAQSHPEAPKKKLYKKIVDDHHEEDKHYYSKLEEAMEKKGIHLVRVKMNHPLSILNKDKWVEGEQQGQEKNAGQALQAIHGLAKKRVARAMVDKVLEREDNPPPGSEAIQKLASARGLVRSAGRTVSRNFHKAPIDQMVLNARAKKKEKRSEIPGSEQVDNQGSGANIGLAARDLQPSDLHKKAGRFRLDEPDDDDESPFKHLSQNEKMQILDEFIEANMGPHARELARSSTLKSPYAFPIPEMGQLNRVFKQVDFDPEKIASEFTEKLAQVEPYQQETQWTCSAACLRAVLKHFGTDIDETGLVTLIGAKENRGAEVTEIAKAARKMEFAAFDYDFDSLDQAKALLDQDIPIICDIQSFKHPGKGHYVVMTKIEDDKVHLMDPNTEGNSRVITREEMDGRWWDYTMAKPHQLKPKWGVVIAPKDDLAKEAMPKILEEKLSPIIEKGLTKVKVPEVASLLSHDVPGTGWSRGLVGKINDKLGKVHKKLKIPVMAKRNKAERAEFGKKVTEYISKNPDEAIAAAAPGGALYIAGKKGLHAVLGE
jgi:predicted double-glycine peptidase